MAELLAAMLDELAGALLIMLEDELATLEGGMMLLELASLEEAGALLWLLGWLLALAGKLEYGASPAVQAARAAHRLRVSKDRGEVFSRKVIAASTRKAVLQIINW